MIKPESAVLARRLRAALATLNQRRPSRERLVSGTEHGIMACGAALLAYLPTSAVGLHEGFWSAITAIAVVQTKFDATRATARDQFTGAACGGIVGVAMGTLAGVHLWSYGLAVFLAIVTCWLANVSSAARLAGSTVTIILLVPHQGSVVATMLARISEVAWGVTIALAIVWLVQRLRQTSD